MLKNDHLSLSIQGVAILSVNIFRGDRGRIGEHFLLSGVLF